MYASGRKSARSSCTSVFAPTRSVLMRAVAIALVRCGCERRPSQPRALSKSTSHSQPYVASAVSRTPSPHSSSRPQNASACSQPREPAPPNRARQRHSRASAADADRYPRKPQPPPTSLANQRSTQQLASLAPSAHPQHERASLKRLRTARSAWSSSNQLPVLGGLPAGVSRLGCSLRRARRRTSRLSQRCPSCWGARR